MLWTILMCLSKSVFVPCGMGNCKLFVHVLFSRAFEVCVCPSASLFPVSSLFCNGSPGIMGN